MRGEKPDEHIREPMLWYENEGGGQATWIDESKKVRESYSSKFAHLNSITLSTNEQINPIQPHLLIV